MVLLLSYLNAFVFHHTYLAHFRNKIDSVWCLVLISLFIVISG